VVTRASDAIKAPECHHCATVLGAIAQGRVDDPTCQAIRSIADADNRKVSNVVRDALRSYLAAR